MSVRITTWNVNGIRNPFSYYPWTQTRTFEAMFDILEADIVCMQETKIQRKDLKDEMVLVPGWDCFFTFPTYKKGYSGVAIYTRQSKCNPIKAEEGITGILEPQPGQSYLSLSPPEAIGGYPELPRKDALLLDSEGRCLVLDFGGFVLINVYCPVAAGAERDEFRTGFNAAVSERVRNLVEVLHRRVVVVGDLNIARSELDSAKEIVKLRGFGNFKEAPTWKILDNLLKPHPAGIMLDLCREYFPERLGMYTCWESRIDGRPANYGSRVDYILCSSDMEAWFSEANIQEGLKGSDHCPVYSILKEKVTVEGVEKSVIDILNPPELFVNGSLQKPRLPPKLNLSARLYPEFGGRQSIRDMFARITTSPASTSQSLAPVTSTAEKQKVPSNLQAPAASKQTDSSKPQRHPAKRRKTSAAKANSKGALTKKQASSGQQTLTTFFKRTTAAANEPEPTPDEPTEFSTEYTDSPGNTPNSEPKTPLASVEPFMEQSQREALLIGPAESKEKWSRLFTKPDPPMCDQHNEPCTQRVTKKPGANCGRSFWMCSRPTGPDGNLIAKGEQGKHKEWKCNYFKWCSDWTGNGENST